MTTEELMAQDFGTLADLIASQARERPAHARSEERRVGKECRPRWAP